jgi:L-ribulose-5-phosphate 3-epimerase
MPLVSLRYPLRALAALGFVLVLALTGAPRASAQAPTVGLQTWSLRNLSFDQVVEFATQHGFKQLQMFGRHIDPLGPVEETLRKKAILDAKGLTLYTFGVTNTSLDQAENRRLFEFAKVMGVKVIVVEPRDFRIFDLLEELVKEYDIRIAIHNHGIRTLYGNPLVVRTLIAHRDPRVGVCLDVGWVTAAGFDAAKVFKDYGARVFDIHLKDKRTERTQGGEDVHLDVMVGTGEANYAGLLTEMKAASWNGVMAIETDNAEFAKDPTAFVLGAREFIQKAVP